MREVSLSYSCCHYILYLYITLTFQLSLQELVAQRLSEQVVVTGISPPPLPGTCLGYLSHLRLGSAHIAGMYLIVLSEFFVLGVGAYIIGGYIPCVSYIRCVGFMRFVGLSVPSCSSVVSGVTGIRGKPGTRM